jgi:cysteine desulfurase/selenocysteine lyase
MSKSDVTLRQAHKTIPKGCNTAAALAAGKIRHQFPILETKVHGKPLIYLDSAATTQKPVAVIEAVQKHFTSRCSNVHRGVHKLSQLATESYESSRETIRKGIGAAEAQEIIFTRGTTEAINLVAQTFGRKHFREGDEVLITAMEHHSNIVPWQMLRDEKGIVLKVVPMNDRGEIDLNDYEALLCDRTCMVAVTLISNALGTINPVKEMAQLAHARNIPILVDGAQAVGHLVVDVQDLDCDFFAFSGHKMYAPSGIGALYGKADLLNEMPPYQGGGDMIATVTFDKTVYNGIPHRFEAGTPNIIGAIGMGAAFEFLNETCFEAITAHEDDLLRYGIEQISAVPGVRMIGTAAAKADVISFNLEGAHPHDVGTILDLEGIAIRAGHHCAQPTMDFFGVPATVRASFAVYNLRSDIDRLVEGLHKVREVFCK